MVRNLKLVVAYDGSAFYGWQKTKMGLSVEAALQTALEQILQAPVQLQAASRTDRGVHALGQVVNFFAANEVNMLSINSLLPKSIVVRSLEEMPEHFHPTLDVVSKEYCYEICYGNHQLPQHRQRSWFVPVPSLDCEAMQKAADLFVGTHDFSAFCLNRKKGEYDDCRRTIEQIKVEEIEPYRLRITIIGHSFFYKMVRCLVGTLVEVGRGKRFIADMQRLLAMKDRALAGVTGPAHGLTLVQVNY
jgi:tRNA pseudouridine38-40 synthase